MSDRTDTCHGKACPFWKRYGEYCPNFVIGKWRTGKGHEYETKDCAPKRSMILSQQIYDSMIGVRMDYNEVRNASEKVLQLAAQSIGVELLIEDGVVEDTKQIEETTDHGKDTD